LKLTALRHEPPSGLFVTAELLVAQSSSIWCLAVTVDPEMFRQNFTTAVSLKMSYVKFKNV